MADEAAAKARVLLVDDSKVMRAAAKKMLSGEFEVVTAEDGQAGWETLQSDGAIQVLFTDLSMPRLDGYELLERVRCAEDPGLRNLPVIVVTGAEDDDAAREQALEQGATDFISKPFNSTALLARARAHASYQRVTAKLQQQAAVDTLTGLANKAALLERLEQALSFARRREQPLSLVVLEIDDFKKLFLAHGRERADALVAGVGELIRAGSRREDTVARLGLASFAIVSPASPAAGSQAMAERMRARAGAAPVEAQGRAVTLSLSAAVVEPQPEHDAEGVLAAAQALLEQAVSAGGDRVLSGAGQAGAAEQGQAPGIDALLELLARGDVAAVRGQLPQALARLQPLLELLDAGQRARLIEQLEQAELAGEAG